MLRSILFHRIAAIVAARTQDRCGQVGG